MLGYEEFFRLRLAPRPILLASNKQVGSCHPIWTHCLIYISFLDSLPGHSFQVSESLLSFPPLLTIRSPVQPASRRDIRAEDGFGSRDSPLLEEAPVQQWPPVGFTLTISCSSTPSCSGEVDNVPPRSFATRSNQFLIHVFRRRRRLPWSTRILLIGPDFVVSLVQPFLSSIAWLLFYFGHPRCFATNVFFFKVYIVRADRYQTRLKWVKLRQVQKYWFLFPSPEGKPIFYGEFLDCATLKVIWLTEPSLILCGFQSNIASTLNKSNLV